MTPYSPVGGYYRFGEVIMTVVTFETPVQYHTGSCYNRKAVNVHLHRSGNLKS